MIAVGCRGSADGAEVEDEFQRRVAGEEFVELVRRNDAGRRMTGEVAPLAVVPSVSATTVSCPRRVNAACRLEPMKPAPPVIRIMAALNTECAGAAAEARENRRVAAYCMA